MFDLSKFKCKSRANPPVIHKKAPDPLRDKGRRVPASPQAGLALFLLPIWRGKIFCVRKIFYSKNFCILYFKFCREIPSSRAAWDREVDCSRAWRTSSRSYRSTAWGRENPSSS